MHLCTEVHLTDHVFLRKGPAMKSGYSPGAWFAGKPSYQTLSGSPRVNRPLRRRLFDQRSKSGPLGRIYEADWLVIFGAVADPGVQGFRLPVPEVEVGPARELPGDVDAVWRNTDKRTNDALDPYFYDRGSTIPAVSPCWSNSS